MCCPSAKFALTEYGEVVSEPNELLPSKNSTPVTPSGSVAFAVIVTFVGPVMDAPLAGEVMDTVGAPLSTTTVPNMKVKCGSQWYGYVPGVSKVRMHMPP